jgi:hypothetical protein
VSLQRRSKFGFPPGATPGSSYTVRMVPLTQGLHLDQSWPILPPGSTHSMTNFLPLDGVLVPRSRLSSLSTGAILGAAYGMAELPYAAGNQAGSVWYSASTQHALINSNGSISRASFVSSFGLGVGTLASKPHKYWSYAPVFIGTHGSSGENVLVAAGSSKDTLHVLYQTAGATGSPLYSYLTSAPKAKAVAVQDNYIIAWNIEGTGNFTTRVQWCVRGSPSNWTGEGSGFEDLLSMKGEGTAIHGTDDGRVILFSDFEIWYGLPAAYPAQFQFTPLEGDVGCVAPMTIQKTPQGLMFLGSDWALRILPAGGGKSQIVVPQVGRALRHKAHVDAVDNTWGLYDATRKLYYLFIEETTTNQVDTGVVVNMQTGECGFLQFSSDVEPFAGVALGVQRTGSFSGTEGILLGTSAGYVFSFNSRVARDGGHLSGVTSEVTSTYRSAPIANDLPGNWKQLTTVNLDYRATSPSTVTLRIAGDANTYETTGVVMSLATAPVAGRVSQDVYRGGVFPTIELTSTSTGYELHRVDVAMSLGGRGR